MSRAKQIATKYFPFEESCRSRSACEAGIKQFAREMAEAMRTRGNHFLGHSHNAADGNEPTLARIMREKSDSYENAARLILEAAGIEEG